MIRKRKQKAQDLQGRLQEAQSASREIDSQGVKVGKQLGLVDKLAAGWRRVHEINHLAELFHEHGRL